jgi:hypothetical protein
VFVPLGYHYFSKIFFRRKQGKRVEDQGSGRVLVVCLHSQKKLVTVQAPKKLD